MLYPPKPYFFFMKNKLDFFSEHESGYFYNIFSSNFTKINPIENEISLTFISPKPSPKPLDVQLLSTRYVTKVHLLQKFLDPQKQALIRAFMIYKYSYHRCEKKRCSRLILLRLINIDACIFVFVFVCC
jgi:hypothetical protein